MVYLATISASHVPQWIQGLDVKALSCAPVNQRQELSESEALNVSLSSHPPPSSKCDLTMRAL